MSKGLHKAVNRYISTITAGSSVDSFAESGIFSTQDITVEGFSLPQGNVRLYVTLEFGQFGKEEIFRISNISGADMTWDKRIPVGGFVKPSHSGGCSLRVNDVSELVNDIGLHVDTLGFTEIIPGTQTVFVSGGNINHKNIPSVVPDRTLSVTAGGLVDNSTNYVLINLATGLIVVSPTNNALSHIAVASVVVTGGAIGVITDIRPAFNTTYEEIATKVDTVGGLRTGMTPNSAFFSNGSGEEVPTPILGFVPTGAVFPFSGSSAPLTYLMADGTAVSRITYSVLFSLIGSIYGNGDGSTTFNLPNFKGRVPVGLDAGQTEFDTMGETGGAKTHTLTEAQIPAHSHYITTEGGYGPPYSVSRIKTGVTDYSVGGLNSGAAGGGQAHNNLQPYLVLNYIIKT